MLDIFQMDRNLPCLRVSTTPEHPEGYSNYCRPCGSVLDCPRDRRVQLTVTRHSASTFEQLENHKNRLLMDRVLSYLRWMNLCLRQLPSLRLVLVPFLAVNPGKRRATSLKCCSALPGIYEVSEFMSLFYISHSRLLKLHI